MSFHFSAPFFGHLLDRVSLRHFIFHCLFISLCVASEKGLPGQCARVVCCPVKPSLLFNPLCVWILWDFVIVTLIYFCWLTVGSVMAIFCICGGIPGKCKLAWLRNFFLRLFAVSRSSEIDAILPVRGPNVTKPWLLLVDFIACLEDVFVSVTDRIMVSGLFVVC